MKIIEWHIEGNVFFMGPLAILLLINLVLIAQMVYRYYVQGISGGKSEINLITIKFIGGFALAFGIFSQTLGLVGAFGAIASMGAVSQEILAAGLKVSMYTTIYGFIIFLISQAGWFLLKRKSLSLK